MTGAAEEDLEDPRAEGAAAAYSAKMGGNSKGQRRPHLSRDELRNISNEWGRSSQVRGRSSEPRTCYTGPVWCDFGSGIFQFRTLELRTIDRVLSSSRRSLVRFLEVISTTKFGYTEVRAQRNPGKTSAEFKIRRKFH
jgi:hypothetical protein